jgi:hypothetical protein
MGFDFCSLRYSVDCSWYSRFQVLGGGGACERTRAKMVKAVATAARVPAKTFMPPPGWRTGARGPWGPKETK